jgi:hypothetical protein
MVDKITGIYTLTGIAEIDGVNKEQIFDEIYRYIVLNYSNINNVIIQTNGNVYSIYAKVSQTASNWYKGELTYKLFIEIKDDKFRYTFSNFILNGISFHGRFCHP